MIGRLNHCHHRMTAIPGHVVRQIEDLLTRVEHFASPMVFQDAPHSFNGVVLAMVGRIIGQFQVDIVCPGKLHQALDELRPTALRLGTVVHVQDERMGAKTPSPLRPQVMEPIHDKIGGHGTLREKEPEIVRRRQEEAKQLDRRLRGEIVIARDDTATIVASTGIGTKPNRRLGVQ